jgi:hypothetical protein
MVAHEGVDGPDPVGSVDSEQRRRFRSIGFSGAGACFLVSQVGLLWTLSTGGIGAQASPAALLWLLATAGAGFFLFLISNSYRRTPAWPIATGAQ